MRMSYTKTTDCRISCVLLPRYYFDFISYYFILEHRIIILYILSHHTSPDRWNACMINQCTVPKPDSVRLSPVVDWHVRRPGHVVDRMWIMYIYGIHCTLDCIFIQIFSCINTHRSNWIQEPSTTSCLCLFCLVSSTASPTDAILNRYDPPVLF